MVSRAGCRQQGVVALARRLFWGETRWLRNTVSVSLIRKKPSSTSKFRRLNTQINDVLLTALVQAFAEWTGEQTLLVDQEGHGREDIFDDACRAPSAGLPPPTVVGTGKGFSS